MWAWESKEKGRRKVSIFCCYCCTHKKLIQYVYIYVEWMYKKPNERKLTYRNFLVKHFAEILCGYCFSCAMEYLNFIMQNSWMKIFTSFSYSYIYFYAIEAVTILRWIRSRYIAIKFLLILIPFHRVERFIHILIIIIMQIVVTSLIMMTRICTLVAGI